MYSVVICNDDRDCNGRSKNKNRKHSQQTSCDHSITKRRAKQAKASAAAVQLNATNVYTLSDFDTLSNKWQANQEMMLYQGYSDAVIAGSLL